jgi:hypothetical protein
MEQVRSCPWGGGCGQGGGGSMWSQAAAIGSYVKRTFNMEWVRNCPSVCVCVRVRVRVRVRARALARVLSGIQLQQLSCRAGSCVNVLYEQ